MCRRRPGGKRGQQNQALGRSRGGFGSKLHALVDGLGNPLRFRLTAAQTHDITQAHELIADYAADFIIADKGYDAEHFIEAIEACGALPVIPSRSNKKQQRYYDAHLYRERHLVEFFFSKLKHFRRIFTRYDKLASRYLSFVYFAATLIWFR